MLVLVLAAALLAPKPEAVVETAKGYIGASYVYGDEGTRGFDCSGFVQRVFAEHATVLPRTSREQATLGIRIPWAQVRAGDLLFFTDRPGGKNITHVGIAVDREHMIHASTGRKEIVIDPLSLAYYDQRRMFARRILGVAPTSDKAKSSPTAKGKKKATKRTTRK